MSDVYMPGVKSRFNSDKIIEDLMKVERVPRERIDRDKERLETQKTYWQELGRRIGTLRDSARILFSFQNPFNDRTAVSSDPAVITATATREAGEQSYNFTVKQTAQADRFLSNTLANDYKVPAGDYTFTVGENKVSFAFRGGSLKEFADALNRRGKDFIGASLISVQPNTKSLLIESKVTGAGQRLSFGAGPAEQLAVETGIIEHAADSRRDIAASSAREIRGAGVTERAGSAKVSTADGMIKVAAGGMATLPLNPPVQSNPSLVLRFETATTVTDDGTAETPSPPPGPTIPPAGSVSYGGITIENEPSSTTKPEWKTPEPPKRVDDMNMLSVTFTDGTSTVLPPVKDSQDFTTSQYRLSDIAGGKSVASIEIQNRNTHRGITVRNITIFDPNALGGIKPKNPVSTAQDAVITMEGIQIQRPNNDISDLIPGVTITAHSPSDRPVSLDIEPDRKGIKDSIIALVGNYNRLMADMNVLTRFDDKIVQELSYLTPEEQEELRKKLGAFSGDSTIAQFKDGLQRVAAAPYPTIADRDLTMLAQIGIGTDVRRAGGGGYDPSRLRGYLEIDEKVLDRALETQLPAIQQLFGNDTDGDLIVDTGVAYRLDTLTKPYVETGGFIALKTGTLDSKIAQDQRRADTLERQLAAKETALKLQFAQMEGAYARMEQMGQSLDNFSKQNSSNDR